jgi:cyclopropane fatty-acyl-phospholipid synthase-like methyltransferase
VDENLSKSYNIKILGIPPRPRGLGFPCVRLMNKATTDFYIERFKNYGANNVVTLGWSTKESQFQRFSLLTEIGIKDGDTVLDVGCGFGDYKNFLISKNRKVCYEGIDLNSDFIKICKQNHPDVIFRCCDIFTVTQKYDWMIASGIFSFDGEEWESRAFSILETMLKKTNKGIATNFLSSLSNIGIPINKKIHPSWIIDNFILKLTKKFVLRHDYFENEFLVYLYT